MIGDGDEMGVGIDVGIDVGIEVGDVIGGAVEGDATTGGDEDTSGEEAGTRDGG